MCRDRFLVPISWMTGLFGWKGHDLRGQIQGQRTGNTLAAKVTVRLAWNVSQSIPLPSFQDVNHFQVNRSWPSRSNSRSNDGERFSGQSYRPIGLKCQMCRNRFLVPISRMKWLSPGRRSTHTARARFCPYKIIMFLTLARVQLFTASNL